MNMGGTRILESKTDTLLLPEGAPNGLGRARCHPTRRRRRKSAGELTSPSVFNPRFIRGESKLSGFAFRLLFSVFFHACVAMPHRDFWARKITALAQ